MNVAPGSNHDN